MYVYTYVGISRMLSKISTENRFTLSNAIDLMYFGLAASALKTVFRCQPSPVTTAETAATTSAMSTTKIVSS